jgi:L-asparaginase
MTDARILAVLTGGTIGSLAGEDGLQPGDAERLRARLRGYVPAHVDFLDLFAHDSSDVQPEHWLAIAHAIAAHQHAYTGFIVLHGTDTLAESATAQAFLLRNLGVPVVFTGAQVPLESAFPSDGFRNVVNAVRVAESDLAEVVIVVGDRILRAARARKLSAIHFDAFGSVDAVPLGEIGPAGLWFYGARTHRPAERVAVTVEGGFSPDVLLYKVMPGMPPSMLEWAVDAGVEGIVFEGYGTGNLPISGAHSYRPVFERALAAGIPVVIATRCVRAVVGDDYAVGAVRLGAISALDMTAEAAYIKLKMALAACPPEMPAHARIEAIRRFMQTNLAGELGVYAPGASPSA